MSTWIFFDVRWIKGHELLPGLRYTAVARVGHCGEFRLAQANDPKEILQSLRGMLETARVREMQEYGEYDVEGWIFFTEHLLDGGVSLAGDACVHRLWHEQYTFYWTPDDGFGELVR